MEIIHGGRGFANGKTANGTRDDEAWLFVKESDGSIRWRNRFAIGRGFRNADALVGDFLGDGKPVIAAAAYSHGWNSWDGDIGIVCLIDPITRQMLEGFVKNLETTVRIEAAADLNGSGATDLLLSLRDGSTKTGSLLLIETVPGLPVRHRFSIPKNTVRAGAVTDFNGDGTLNVIAFSNTSLYVLDNRLRPIVSLENPWPIQDLNVSDITGDGRNEIILWDRSMVRVYAVSAD